MDQKIHDRKNHNWSCFYFKMSIVLDASLTVVVYGKSFLVCKMGFCAAILWLSTKRNFCKAEQQISTQLIIHPWMYIRLNKTLYAEFLFHCSFIFANLEKQDDLWCHQNVKSMCDASRMGIVQEILLHNNAYFHWVIHSLKPSCYIIYFLTAFLPVFS